MNGARYYSEVCRCWYSGNVLHECLRCKVRSFMHWWRVLPAKMRQRATNRPCRNCFHGAMQHDENGCAECLYLGLVVRCFEKQ
jgi:hypothetical protein